MVQNYFQSQIDKNQENCTRHVWLSLLLRDSRFTEKCSRKMLALSCLREMTNFWRKQIKEKKKMNLFEFVNVIFSLETTIEWLKARKLLKSTHTCEDCKNPCSWTKDSAKNDKLERQVLLAMFRMQKKVFNSSWQFLRGQSPQFTGSPHNCVPVFIEDSVVYL